MKVKEKLKKGFERTKDFVVENRGYICFFGGILATTAYAVNLTKRLDKRTDGVDFVIATPPKDRSNVFIWQEAKDKKNKLLWSGPKCFIDLTSDDGVNNIKKIINDLQNSLPVNN